MPTIEERAVAAWQEVTRSEEPDWRVIARHMQEAVAAEREACAKYAQAWADLSSNEHGIVAGREIAKAIRAR